MNTELLKTKMNEKSGSMKKFADDSGIALATLSEYINGKKDPTKPNLKLMSIMLDVSEKELMETPKPKKAENFASASELIIMDGVKEEINNLTTEIHTLRNELTMMAKMLIEINKTGHETHAQAKLNADDLSSIFSKVGEINGNVTKIYATKKKGY